MKKTIMLLLSSLLASSMLVGFHLEVQAQGNDPTKNGGVSPSIEKFVRQEVTSSSTIPVGSKVVAIVDYPSSSGCIRKGYTGTLLCYDPNDPILPYLVDWDEPCGDPQSQVCGVLAQNGWWVGFNEINGVGDEIIALRERVTSLENEIASLETQIATLETETAKIANLETKTANLETKTADLETKIASLQAVLDWLIKHVIPSGLINQAEKQGYPMPEIP